MSKKQPYTPARYEANRRYDAKTYSKLTFALRLDEDAEIIRELEEALEHGISRREWLRNLYYEKRG